MLRMDLLGSCSIERGNFRVKGSEREGVMDAEIQGYIESEDEEGDLSLEISTSLKSINFVSLQDT